MTNKLITCTECPNGCGVTITLDGEKIIEVVGHICPRGKKYAENECVAPRRVLTSTVKTASGSVVPVKTSAPILKKNIFEVMQKVNSVTAKLPIKIGDVIYANIDEDIDLIATGNLK